MKEKQTAAVNDLKFTAQVFAWMQTTGIYTLNDFNAVVSKHNADFSRLAENSKEIRCLDTALKCIDTLITLKPINDRSKKKDLTIQKKNMQPNTRMNWSSTRRLSDT